MVLDCSVEKMQPTRVAMKERLDEVRDAALLLRDALNDTPIREFLEIAPSGPIENRVVFGLMLQDLAGRAKRAASSALSTEDGLQKQQFSSQQRGPRTLCPMPIGATAFRSGALRPLIRGIVPGGGLALLRCVKAVTEEEPKCDGDEKTGVEILK
jgi:chaperonin GroEL (HSP60 family)